MKMSQSQHQHKVILYTALLAVLFHLGSSLRMDSWKTSAGLQAPVNVDEDESIPVLKAALQEAASRQMEDLEALESYLNHQIAELQRKKMDVQRKKRGHFACRVHAIACYRKRTSAA